MSEKLAKPNQSLEKALQIIELMAENREPMRLQDIAAATNIPPSTALRMVNTLLLYGYIIQDSISKRYSLSLKFAQLGSIVHDQLNLRDIAHPILVDLSKQCGELCSVGIRQDDEVVYADVVDGPDSMLKITQRIGKRAPMHCTGIGKILLLEYNDLQFVRFASVHPLERFTPNTICSFGRLKHELANVRENGYALDDEECEIGARCVAVPFYRYGGKIEGGISISGPVARMSWERINEMLPYLRAASKEISKLLSHTSA